MEKPQGNSLCSYLKQPETSFFSSFLIQIGEQEVLGGRGLVPVGGRRVNIVQILCTHVNGKMRPVESTPGMGVMGKGDEGEWWRR
jgi:hypothetical protein